MPIRIVQALVVFMGLWGFYTHAQGREISLQEVELTEVALPVVKINEQEYSFKERDYFIRLLMKSKFWQPSFQLKMALTTFANDSLFTYQMKGKTKVVVDGLELNKKHAYRKGKAIKLLNQQIESLHILKKEKAQIISISTQH